MLKPYYHKIWIEAGLDEVGRGCLAGPSGGCCCYFA